MSRPRILLAGAGGHARACIDVIEESGRYDVAGLTGLPPEVGSLVLGYPVLGTERELEALLRDCPNALVTVGQIKTVEPRERLYALLTGYGATMPAIISPRAHVSRHASIGAGTIVMHNAIVNAGATVGRNCILNSQSLVEHDAEIGDHCHVSTAVAINSGVRVGARTFIGSHSTVRQGLSIGADCVVGMGQRVLKDCPAGSHIPPVRVAP